MGVRTSQRASQHTMAWRIRVLASVLARLLGHGLTCDVLRGSRLMTPVQEFWWNELGL